MTSQNITNSDISATADAVFTPQAVRMMAALLAAGVLGTVVAVAIPAASHHPLANPTPVSSWARYGG